MLFGFLPLFGVIVVLAFTISAIIEGKTSMKKGSVIRSLYFYIASFVALGIVIGSSVFLINLGLTTWVFTQAEDPLIELGPPPVLYLDLESIDGLERSPEALGLSTLSCDEPCELSQTYIENIESWKENYVVWQDASEKPNTSTARDAVSALSFLIVSLPFFIIHFRSVRREARKAQVGDRGVIRPTYYYLVSFTSVLMIVIAGGFIINVILKTWVFPGASETDNYESRAYPMQMSAFETAPVDSLVSCGEACGLDQNTITIAGDWKTDYTNWQEESSKYSYSNPQRQAASAIPFILLGIPLFLYHWRVIRKEHQEIEKQESS
ncbi:DUF5671 domain-containing protein [Patescibacteria group bacterium]